MATITTLDRETVKKLNEAVLKCLNANLNKLGLNATTGSISFNDSSLSTKLTIAVVGDINSDNEDNIINHRSKFVASLRSFIFIGVKDSHFDTEFKYNGKTFKLRYFKPRSRNCVVGLNVVDGRLYKLPLESLASIKGIKV
jgi:hypothetical protein